MLKKILIGFGGFVMLFALVDVLVGEGEQEEAVETTTTTEADTTTTTEPFVHTSPFQEEHEGSCVVLGPDDFGEVLASFALNRPIGDDWPSDEAWLSIEYLDANREPVFPAEDGLGPDHLDAELVLESFDTWDQEFWFFEESYTNVPFTEGMTCAVAAVSPEDPRS